MSDCLYGYLCQHAYLCSGVSVFECQYVCERELVWECVWECMTACVSMHVSMCECEYEYE